jgi:replicative DNA helicase
MISLEVLMGRPASGKTTHAIKMLNEQGKDALLVSLQNPYTDLTEQGLSPTVTVLDLQPALVSAALIVDACRKSGAKLVVIDNLELLPSKILVEDLQQQLQSIGVRKLVLTAHLRRDLIPASKARLEHIRFTAIPITRPDQAP